MNLQAQSLLIHPALLWSNTTGNFILCVLEHRWICCQTKEPQTKIIPHFCCFDAYVNDCFPSQHVTSAVNPTWHECPRIPTIREHLMHHLENGYDGRANVLEDWQQEERLWCRCCQQKHNTKPDLWGAAFTVWCYTLGSHSPDCQSSCFLPHVWHLTEGKWRVHRELQTQTLRVFFKKKK